jgi:predicted secreted protein
MLHTYKVSWSLGIAALALVLLLSGCGASGPQVLTLTGNDAGKTVQVHRGDQFVVVLENNYADSGYDWVIDQTDSARLTLVGKTVQSMTPQTIGSGVIDNFTFKADQAGSVALRFKLWKNWGANQTLNHYAVTIQIAALAGS